MLGCVSKSETKQTSKQTNKQTNNKSTKQTTSQLHLQQPDKMDANASTSVVTTHDVLHRLAASFLTDNDDDDDDDHRDVHDDHAAVNAIRHDPSSSLVSSSSSSASSSASMVGLPHAYHANLPDYHKDPVTHIPYVTTFAHHKARKIVSLVQSIQLSEALFVEERDQVQELEDVDVEDDNSDSDDDDKNEENEKEQHNGTDSHDGVDKRDPLAEGTTTSLPWKPPSAPAAAPRTEPTTLSLQAIAKKCARLQSQLSTLESFKYMGLTQREVGEIVLHLLRLVTCTVEYTTTRSLTETDQADSMETTTDTPAQRNETTVVQLHYENVGYWYTSPGDDEKEQQQQEEEDRCRDADQLETDLKRPFALHSPAREVLLQVLINLVSNKGPLRSVSNASIYPPTDTETTSSPPSRRHHHRRRSLLILHWNALLRTLLRTAPYLDERKEGRTKSDSNSRQNSVLKRTVQLIRDARHFFDQGVRPPTEGTKTPDSNDNTGGIHLVPDKTAREIWDMVQTDILYHSHSHACYRGTILLYLFQPSRCTSDFYLHVMPLWLDAWTNIDRCPEYDFLWLALFCRARKYISPNDYDWGPIRRRLLTNSQYWLQLPIGGEAMDKSFPRTANPRSRQCPPRLKAFTGANSSYEEGIDFVAKVVKLLVTSIGTGAPVLIATSRSNNNNNSSSSSSSTHQETISISEGTNDVLRFLSFVTPYFNPSNLGSWTFTLGAFLHYFAFELCQRVGCAAGLESLQSIDPTVVDSYFQTKPGEAVLDIPAHEVVILLDALLPLCQQAIYSKNGHVGRAGEAAMLYLVQIDPVRAAPPFIDFAVRALDVAAVNQSHQAPAALSALTRLIQPALRTDRAVLLMRLPQLLNLSLPGIDSNDQNKCIRTLILYRNITSWIPVGGSPETWSVLNMQQLEADRGAAADGTMRIGKDLFDVIVARREKPDYLKALESLSEESLLKQNAVEASSGPDFERLVMEEAISAMSDWSLEFLDRVFALLRASGEREKAGKRASGVASRHSSADVHQARNFSRVLTECLMQLFSSMDDEIHQLSVRAVGRFLEEETLPSAAKDASLLCQAASAARLSKTKGSHSPGLDTLIPILTLDLQHCSTKTAIYRLRCCAGAVRFAGVATTTHRKAISGAIEFALSSDDRHLFKTGCKLLRHTLSTLSESYPLSTSSKPRVYKSSEGLCLFGRSAQLHGDAIDWHVPNSDCVSFASELFKLHVSNRLDKLSEDSGLGDGTECRSRMLNSTDVLELRRCLRVIRYSLRGGASLLLDNYDNVQTGEDFVPYEKAMFQLLETADEQVKVSLLRLRGRLCSFLIVISALIASETLHPDAVLDLPAGDPYRKVLPIYNSDRKICKETCDIASILLTRRGAAFRSQEARAIWKAQKQVATDFTLCAQADCMTEILQSAALYGKASTILYKDGEDAGKAVPRRLLVSRLQLFHNSLQRNASFEVPRRLRRLENESKVSRKILFATKENLPDMIANLEDMLKGESHCPLDSYEGVIDGLFGLCCHSNTQVRASAISIVDYAITRFGWIVAPRVPRLLSGLALEDEGMNGKFGIPACALLVEKLNHQGKRKRLAEAIKGVCSVLSRTRAIRQILGSWKMRYRFVKTVCGTDALISLIPTEEVQKIVHYLQAVFSPFQSSVYVLPLTSRVDRFNHDQCISLTLEILGERKVDVEDDVDSTEKNASHWRKQLLACWFLLAFIDEKVASVSPLWTEIWSTCFRLIENNMGQPLQRVALGLLGKLISLSNSGSNVILSERMKSVAFCKVLCHALVFDHREDTSVGGGHDAQWSTGVENIIRDSSRHVAPRTLFPFHRTSQSMGSFKVAHCQLLETVLSVLSDEEALLACDNLKSFSIELAASPPSEDQRNQQITSAEIYAGLCGYYIRSSKMSNKLWTDQFLPHLDDVMAKIPFSLCGAYCDAIRYALQFAPSESFYPLTVWLIEKVESTLWQPDPLSKEKSPEIVAQTGNGSSLPGSEGFTAQSKWMYLLSSVIIEMDETEIDGLLRTPPWYQEKLLSGGDVAMNGASPNSRASSWQLVIDRLLPRLIEALGHPFDSCRDLIARCLFRICYSHRKFKRITASRAPSRSNSSLDLSGDLLASDDPGFAIVAELVSLEKGSKWTNIDRCNALSTARRFMSYCVHLGEAKFEFSDYVIPLLPLSFEALNLSSEDAKVDNSNGVNKDELATRRALEAEVVKGYRQKLSEVSVTAVISYGRSFDITRVLEVVEAASKHETWQVRHAAANFIRCFEGAHKFLLLEEHKVRTTSIVTGLLADQRREVSSAAMAALTGILSSLPIQDVSRMVEKYIKIAARAKMKRMKKGVETSSPSNVDVDAERGRNQQESVFFLCASIMAQPYDTPAYVPAALAAISKHSFERNAILSVRDTVKRCCAEYKRTHMSDNWEVHRSKFSQEQLEAFEDVVSTPHYYA